MTRSRSTDTSQITENEFRRRTYPTSVLRHSKNRVHSNFIRKGSSKKQVVVLSCLLRISTAFIGTKIDDLMTKIALSYLPSRRLISPSFPTCFFSGKKALEADEAVS